MNFNYDPTTNKAISSFSKTDINNQFRLDNTYIHFGAGFYANVQFSTSKGFAFEVSLSGGAGYNIDLQMPNGLDLTAGIVRFPLIAAASTTSSALVKGI